MTSEIPADFTLYNFIALKEENEKLKKDCNEAYRKGLYSNNENVVRHINDKKTLTCDLQTTKKENEKLKRQMEELKETVKDHDSDNDVLIENIEKLMKERSDNFLSSSLKMTKLEKEIKELKKGNNNVYNEDERGPWIKAKCNFSYVGEFLESRDICPWKTREDEAEEKFQFACEEIASVISSCINTTIKMGNCQELSDYITEEVNDMIDKLIESGHLVEGDEDSSDEDED